MPGYFGLHRWWWWSGEDRRKFRRRVKRASPYILILFLPGSFFILPLYALWREKQRRRRRLDTPALATPSEPEQING